MGPPAEKLERGGESIWYYPRGPSGWHSYAVRIAPDGVLRSVEQRLTAENFGKVIPGTSTASDVRELVGPPFIVSRLPRLEREAWEYQMLDAGRKWKVWVQFSADGVVREVLRLQHPDEYSPNGHGHPQ